MKNKIRLVVTSVLVITISALVVFGNNLAYANDWGKDGWVSPTDYPVSTEDWGGESGCGNVCNGQSWIYYQAVSGASEEDIVFGSAYTTVFNTSSPANISSVCYNGGKGGFWHYGFNKQAVNSYADTWGTGLTYWHFGLLSNLGIGGTPKLYSTSENKYGHWISVPYGYYNSVDESPVSDLDHTIYDSNGNPMYRAMFSTTSNAYYMSYDSSTGIKQGPYSLPEMYTMARAYYEGVEMEEVDEMYDSVPTGTYAFCWWDSMKKPKENATYYGVSNASGRATGGGGNDYVSTGVIEKGRGEEVVTDVSIKSGESVELAFSHNTYANEYEYKKDGKTYTSSINWSVSRDTNGGVSLDNNGDGYEITTKNFASPISDTTLFNNEKETADGKNYYVARTRRSEYGGYKYLARDTATIKFTKKGTYKFCETLTLKNSDESARYTTRACVEINVDGGDPNGGGSNPPGLGFTSGTSKVISQVKNMRLVGTYSGWRGAEGVVDVNDAVNVTYAKPGDIVKWVNQYSPGAIVNANKTITISHGPTSGASCPTTNRTFSSEYSFISRCIVDTTSPSKFDRDFSGKILDPLLSTVVSPDFGTSNTGTQSLDNKHKIGEIDVGETYYDTIQTDTGVPSYTSVETETHKWQYDTTCPDVCVAGGYNEKGVYVEVPYACEVPCKKDASHTWYDYEYKDTKLSSGSYVKIPYNFNNSASLTISGTAYSGEEIVVGSASVTVGKKRNDVVEDRYATKVDNAQVKMIAYVSSSDDSGRSAGIKGTNSEICVYVNNDRGICRTVEQVSGELSGGLNSGIISKQPFIGHYSVYDAKAGDWFCMALGVYPATSGGDTNLDPSGDGNWYLSSPQCRVIKKKPSFEVWGGGLYSAGNMEALESRKNNVYKKKGNGGAEFYTGDMTFGSWIEQDIIANGTVKNIASGAGFGKTSSNDVGYGLTNGIKDDCPNNIAQLTFANYSNNNCKNGEVGNAKIDAKTTNLSALVDYIASMQVDESKTPAGGFSNDGVITFTSVRKSNTGKTVNIYESDTGDYSFNSGVGMAFSNYTGIVKVGGSIYINNNINKPNSQYGSIMEIPQLVLYAGENIYIGCGVSQIDAILIARGAVYTCFEEDTKINDSGKRIERGEYEKNLNAGARSTTQLMINGAVIANRLVLGRTYGSSFGVGSVLQSGGTPGSNTPAEIINYDTSAFLWSESMASVEESDNMTVSYQHELAPRY